MNALCAKKLYDEFFVVTVFNSEQQFKELLCELKFYENARKTCFYENR